MEENPAYGQIQAEELYDMNQRCDKNNKLALGSVRSVDRSMYPTKQKTSFKQTYMILLLMVCGLLFLITVLQIVMLILMMTNNAKLVNEISAPEDRVEMCLPPIGTIENPVTSCNKISYKRPSGYYWLVADGEGVPLLVYCDTNRTSCSCNTTGGWMRVANFDMTNPNQNCPYNFKLITRSEPPLRVCGRNDFGCVSTTYPVYGISYSQVCGRVVAYQDKTPDAFYSFHSNQNKTIDGWYVDGISLTHGQSPRQHIWTFAAAVSENIATELTCPCIQPDEPFNGTISSFVGNDYFCETAYRGKYANFVLQSDNLLWDGTGCGGSSTCCQFNNPPWFCKQLPQPTTDDIELRICGDENIDNEDIPIEIVEIFVR